MSTTIASRPRYPRRASSLIIASNPSTPVNEVTEERLEWRRHKFGVCSACGQPNTAADDWCGSCVYRHYRMTNPNWTSRNAELDRFIQDIQRRAESRHGFLEWVPFNRFTNVKYVGKGGISTVRSAMWIDGYPESWDAENQRLVRYRNARVALKSLDNSHDITPEFLNEAKACVHQGIEDYNVIQCHGITQDPDTMRYMMVLEYANDGSLREYYRQNVAELAWEDKLNILQMVSNGLKSLHRAGYIHRNFHTANILQNGNIPIITDLGLSRPVHDASGRKRNRIWGVLPFIPPEMLLGRGCIPASDVYSFAMIMYELAMGVPPFHDRAHDDDLALDVCRGLRPALTDPTIPRCYVELMSRCWHQDPKKRPIIDDIENILWSWYEDVSDQRPTEISEEFHESDMLREKRYRRPRNGRNHRRRRTGEVDKPLEVHEQAIYTSRYLSFPSLHERLQELEGKYLNLNSSTQGTFIGNGKNGTESPPNGRTASKVNNATNANSNNRGAFVGNGRNETELPLNGRTASKVNNATNANSNKQGAFVENGKNETESPLNGRTASKVNNATNANSSKQGKNETESSLNGRTANKVNNATNANSSKQGKNETESPNGGTANKVNNATNARESLNGGAANITKSLQFVATTVREAASRIDAKVVPPSGLRATISKMRSQASQAITP